MDSTSFLDELKNDPRYAGQIVHVREIKPRNAVYSSCKETFSAPVQNILNELGISKLYVHQAQAIDEIRDGHHVAIVTGTSSGKSLCYQIPVFEILEKNPLSTFLLLFPTKALCQDQNLKFSSIISKYGIGALCGVYDGDTPQNVRRKLRDNGRVLFTNPDMLHAGIMPNHGKWERFFRNLTYIIIDELHVYNGILGSNAVQLFRRVNRLCAHYGSIPQYILCSATIGNPEEIGEQLTEKKMVLIDKDGSPSGRKTYVFWNPPQIRETRFRSRRSANVEAHELMTALILKGYSTITFSKAKMTSELIHRYVIDALEQIAPQLKKRITPYRGGYRPEERRQIEQKLFSGELLGVSTTNALELGIDIGSMDASLIVGYPGTLASFFQQAGRTGRGSRDALIILIGLDTTINQYVMEHPDYVFGRTMENGVLDPDNPFIITGHIRCAAFELPIDDKEKPLFGPFTELSLDILEQNQKLRKIQNKWYHAAAEIPHSEVSLRNYAEQNVIIQDTDTGAVIGELNRLDAPGIIHPQAIYMHRGDTYEVQSLDLERNLAKVKRIEADYYTQPLGGTDIHHVDHTLREKKFGTGTAYWGEVTAYFSMWGYEKVRFYTLDTISKHPVDIPVFSLDTKAFWIVPPESVMKDVVASGMDPHNGLRAIGYATRMLLPLFMTCDTLGFSHSVGSTNSPWNAMFVYERYHLGLGFTEKAFNRLHEIMPAVLNHIRNCPCTDGCPCCVGKPLRGAVTWNVERGEGSIPSKKAALMILDGLLEDGQNLDSYDSTSLMGNVHDKRMLLEMAVRRRLERMREPVMIHSINPVVLVKYPDREKENDLSVSDVSLRRERRKINTREMHRKISNLISKKPLQELVKKDVLPDIGISDSKSVQALQKESVVVLNGEKIKSGLPESERTPLIVGDSLASRARKKLKQHDKKTDQ